MKTAKQSLWTKVAELDRKAANETDPAKAQQLRELADDFQALAGDPDVESSENLR